tara:strand:+ start:2710 stop:4008 length:1299 start_codon:yes stop_codon:yes gene_type:complete
MNLKKVKLGILGIGYVGLPLSLSFARKYKVIAYDSNTKRINELQKSIDTNNEFIKKNFEKIKENITFTNNKKDLADCKIYIVTVPTPINRNKRPNLNYIKLANNIIGSYLDNDNIVIYESTVYPGLTEEYCAPMLEKISKLNYRNEKNYMDIKNNFFYCGYSPERINPGDKKHVFETIPKIVAGSTNNITKILYNLYSSVIKAKVYKAESIKIAEAAKVIENTQRDLNIALMNEFSLIFNKMNIDTNKILKAASTKWNFLNFQPGLVGGHCISVDPYYLTYKSKKMGYNPKLILAGREINDNMGKYISSIAIKKLKKNKSKKILILGLTFKENCSDLRNSQVYEIFKNLNNYYKVDIHDPLALDSEVKIVYNKKNEKILKNNYYNLIIIAVSHNIFKKIGIKKIQNLLLNKDKKNIIDVKSMFDQSSSFFRL